MACKTIDGYLRRERTGDGRESDERYVERSIGVRKQTKKKDKELMKLIGLK